MKTLLFLIACMCLIIGPGSLAEPAAAEELPPLVDASVIADHDAVAPGQTVNVGVVMTMRPGWHIYWRNPGGSGLPTEINITGPEGIEIGDIQWPLPKRYEIEGGVVNYGYEGTVMLTRAVTFPDDLGDAQQITLDIHADWLVCEDQCIPGDARLTLTLPIREQAAPTHAEAFAQQRATLPAESTADLDSRVAVQTTGGLDANTGRGNWDVTLTWQGDRPAKVQWYPDHDDALQLGEAKIASQGRETRISQPASRFAGINVSHDSLVMLVTWQEADGTRHGVHVPVSVYAGNTTPDEATPDENVE